MFKRKSKQQLTSERLDQLMCLMATDENYELYLDLRSELQLEVAL